MISLSSDVKMKGKAYFYSFAIEKGAAPQTLLAVVTDETSATTPFDDNNIPHPETIVNINSTQG